MIEEIFYLLLRQRQKRDKKPEVKLFLVYLLVLLVLVGRPRFYLMFEASALSLTVGLVIDKTELIGKKLLLAYQDSHNRRCL